MRQAGAVGITPALAGVEPGQRWELRGRRGAEVEVLAVDRAEGGMPSAVVFLTPMGYRDALRAERFVVLYKQKHIFSKVLGDAVTEAARAGGPEVEAQIEAARALLVLFVLMLRSWFGRKRGQGAAQAQEKGGRP